MHGATIKTILPSSALRKVTKKTEYPSIKEGRLTELVTTFVGTASKNTLMTGS